MKVRLYRVGDIYSKVNLKRKGVFTKEFDSVEELVNYLVNSGGAIAAFNLAEDLTPKDYKHFQLKYKAIFMDNDAMLQSTKSYRNKYKTKRMSIWQPGKKKQKGAACKQKKN